ncbi:MAG: lytic murein transglycosylase [Methylovirgula sp.]|uniref:lytic murein transglycosylase n=1 Tax=Methylovirgula sp. TaxID=1978224 RepID=UPI0030762C4A
MMRFSLTLVLVAGFCAGPAYADFHTCVAGLAAEAEAHGVSAQVAQAATRDLTFNPDVLTAEKSQPEFNTPVWDYIAALVDEERVTDGRAAMAKYSRWFGVVERRFGVSPYVVGAIWGVESNFGQNFGNKPVLQSLASLACSNSMRPGYYHREFKAAMEIVNEGGANPANFNGSWAGAFGNTQFMPSTFLRLAVDLDGDGRRDVINSVPDALGSTANYLHHSGWVPGLPWGFEVKSSSGFAARSNWHAKQPLSAWAAHGITHVNGAPLTGEGAYGLFLPAGPRGPAFLVSRNFSAIYSYNAAESYALAIALLSDRLRGLGPIVTPWPTNDPGLSRAGRREVQRLLTQHGYDIGGKIDGVLGHKTQDAIADFERRNGMKTDGRASQSVLTALRSH